MRRIERHTNGLATAEAAEWVTSDGELPAERYRIAGDAQTCADLARLRVDGIAALRRRTSDLTCQNIRRGRARHNCSVGSAKFHV